MILSHRHRFVFIKGLKVAGTSVEIALSQICGPDDIITPITPVDERHRLGTMGTPRNYSSKHDEEQEYLQSVAKRPAEELPRIRAPKGAFYNHMPLSEVLALVPEAKDYKLLFVERSPYAKVISFSNWHTNQQAYKAGQPLPRSVSGLAEAVGRIISDGTIAKVRNIDRYRDPEGHIRSQGWRYERVGDSLAAFFAECSETPIELVHAKRGPGSGETNIASVLRPAQIAYINQLFADEFRTFGYSPLTPASE